MPLDEITRAPRNPKEHDREGIAASIDRYGVAELPLLDERTGRLVAGHGRLDDLTARREAGQDPPDGVRIRKDGTWLVPVVRGWASRSDPEAEAYLVASNQLTVNGGWDDTELGELLRDLNELDPSLLEVAGFDDIDLAGLLGEDEPVDGNTEPDDAPDTPTQALSTPGDVWLLGPHRLLVGDGTDMAAVEAMLAGDRADCMWTDPPYGVAYVGKTTATPAQTIQNDDQQGLSDLLAGLFAVATAALKPGAAVYVAHPPGSLSLTFAAAITTAGWTLRQQVIWVKDVLVLGHSDYHYKHEPIWVAYTTGARGRRGRGGDGWYGDNAQVSVFEVPKPARSTDHPTMKPVDLIAPMLTNSCPPGGIVYDPCGGSGSTLVAAHRTGRVARLVELEPKYADVICRRYQQYTGDMPVLESTGEPHDFVSALETADV